MGMVNLADPNTLNILKEATHADKEYKRDHSDIWEANLRRLSGDYVTDMRNEERVFGRANNRRFSYGGRKRTPLYAILPLANPKMHFSIARQVRNSLDFGSISASHKRNDILSSIATDRMLQARMGEQGGQDYEQAYKLALSLKCALPGYMLVEGDKTKPRPRFLGDDKISRGDVIVKAMPAWRVMWEPGVTDVTQMSWCITEEFMTPHEVNRRWPGDDNVDILNDPSSYVNLSEIDILHDMERGLEYSMILVHRLWIAQSDLYPNGAQRIIIGRKYVKKVYKNKGRKDVKWKTDDTLAGKALKAVAKMFTKQKQSADMKPNEEWIGTPDNQIPLVRFGGMPSSVVSLGRGQMDQIGPLQRIANRKFSAYVEVSNTTPDIHYLGPTNMQMDRIHNDVVFISHSQKIAGQGFEVSLRPDLSPWLNEVGWANGMMDQILGQPGASRGEVPGTRTAGTTLQKSKDFASEMEGPENAAFNTSMAGVQKRIVLVGRDSWPPEFMFKAIGESRRAELETFKTTDLTSVVDVWVSREDPLPKEKFARARSVALLQKETGLYGDPATDPKTPRRIRDAMKMPVAEEDERHEHFQNEMVNKHMEALRTDPYVKVEWVCDDDLHIIEESEYLAEEVASDNANEEFQKNVAIHIVFHQINQARKEQWLQIKQQSDKIEEEIQAAVSMENLAPEEKLALAEMEAAEAGGGAVEAGM